MLADLVAAGLPAPSRVRFKLFTLDHRLVRGTLGHLSTTDEKAIIEKIDIGGPSMIRGAAKNHKDVTVVANKRDYTLLENILKEQNGETSLDQRRMFAIKAFDVCTAYDTAISNYFHQLSMATPFNKEEKILRYGENPHQKAVFFGNLNELFDQLNGKELSYNNLVDVDAAMQLIRDAAPPPPEGGISDSNSFTTHNSNQTTETNKTTTVITDSKNLPSEGREAVFAIIKHTFAVLPNGPPLKKVGRQHWRVTRKVLLAEC